MGIEVLILTEADVDEITAGNPYGNGREFPRARRQGCFVVAKSILDEPDFAALHARLADKPVKNTDDPDYPPPIEDE
ncbi:MAG: hypothetical protein ACK4JB_19375 [Reyranella sp.]